MKIARIFSLIVLIGLIGGLVAWALSTGLSMHYWFVLFSPLIALFLFAIWYAVFGWGKGKTRLKIAGVLLLLFVLISAGIRFLTRYDGSTSGTSLPRLVWKWSKPEKKTESITTIVNENAVDQSLEEEAVSVSTNFLGPEGDGMWKEVSFSLDWKTSPPVELWRRPVGEGWSSFAVFRGLAITLEQKGEDESVSCLDLLSGKEIWTSADRGIDFVKSIGNPASAMGGEGPRSTPTIFKNEVYVLGSTGIAKCLDFETGKELWKRDVIKEHEGVIPKWGHSSSPLILEKEGLVVFAGSEAPGATLIACDLESGETKWIYEGNGCSYGTPRLLEILGTVQIVSVNGNDVAGIDHLTGKELWRYDWKGSFPKVGQPHLIGKNRILATASYGVGSPLIEVKKDDAGKWSATQVWKSTRLKTKFSSAVILGDYAYGLDEGRLAAIDLATGRKTWKREKFGFGQQLLVEDHLIVQAENGEVILGQATPQEFVEKTRLEALSSMTWNSPSLAGRFLLVRNDREAICFLLPKKGGS